MWSVWQNRQRKTFQAILSCLKMLKIRIPLILVATQNTQIDSYLYIYIYIYTIGLMSSVHKWSGRPVFNLRSSHTKYSKNGTWCRLAQHSIIRWGSRVKWENPGDGVEPSHTSRNSSYWKGSLRIILDEGRQLYFTIYIDIQATFIWDYGTLCLWSLILFFQVFLFFLCWDQDVKGIVPYFLPKRFLPEVV